MVEGGVRGHDPSPARRRHSHVVSRGRFELALATSLLSCCGGDGHGDVHADDHKVSERFSKGTSRLPSPRSIHPPASLPCLWPHRRPVAMAYRPHSRATVARRTRAKGRLIWTAEPWVSRCLGAPCILPTRVVCRPLGYCFLRRGVNALVRCRSTRIPGATPDEVALSPPRGRPC